MLDVDGAVKFVGSVWDVDTGLQIGDTIEFLDHVNPVLGAGQVGLRLSTGADTSNTSRRVAVDDFRIEAIPEPSAMILSMAGLLAVGLRRSR